jgi:hypothetical protein
MMPAKEPSELQSSMLASLRHYCGPNGRQEYADVLMVSDNVMKATSGKPGLFTTWPGMLANETEEETLP